MHITGSFDGGNPQEVQSIVSTGPDSFVIYPFSEDEDPGYKFRLDVKVLQEEAATQRLKLRIHWKDELYNKYRNHLFAGNTGLDWICHSGIIDGEAVCFEFELPLGETHLTLNPKYDYEDCLNLVQRTEHSSDISRKLITKTDEDREVWLLATDNAGTDLRILLTARAHPYETAGSYCIEGILEEILDGRTEFIRDVQLFLIPMLCPDGVSNGLCKLSSVGGEDIARSHNRGDRLVSSLFSVIDEIKPHFILDFHNWMLPDRNGLFYERPGWMRRFVRLMNQKGHGDRDWIRGVNKIFFSRQPAGLKGYAKDRYATRCMTVEYPWLGRDVRQMKSLGIDTVKTLIHLLTK